MDIDEFQQRVQFWVHDTFGRNIATSQRERAIRMVEEAIEFAQAVGVEAEQLRRLVDYVFSRPVGEPAQEIAGVAVTLAAAASASGIDLEQVATGELERINRPEVVDRCRRRQEEKRAALLVGDR